MSSSDRRRCDQAADPAVAAATRARGEVEQLVVGPAADVQHRTVPVDRQPAARPAAARPRRSTRGRSAMLDQLELDPAGHAGQLVHRALRDERAVVEGDDVVAHPLDLFEHVRRQHHVDAELTIHLADDVEHLVALHRVEAVGRFVEHDELRVGGDRLGELHPLALAGRHRAEGAEPLLAEPDEVERVAARGSAPRHGAAPSPRRGGGRSRRPADRRAGRCARARIRSSPAASGRRHPGSRPSTEIEPVVGRQQAERQRDQRGLAGTVRPDQTGDAGRHRQVEPVERLRRRELHHQAAWSR